MKNRGRRGSRQLSRLGENACNKGVVDCCANEHLGQDILKV